MRLTANSATKWRLPTSCAISSPERSHLLGVVDRFPALAVTDQSFPQQRRQKVDRIDCQDNNDDDQTGFLQLVGSYAVRQQKADAAGADYAENGCRPDVVLEHVKRVRQH